MTSRYGIISGSQMTDNFENIIINHVLRSASSTGSSVWLSLYSDMTEYETGVEKEGEFNTSASYSRPTLLNKFSISNGSATLNQDVSFWTATGQWGSGSVQLFGLSTGSDLDLSFGRYIYGDLKIKKPVYTKSQASVKSGYLSLSTYGHISPNLVDRIFYHYFTNTLQYPTPGSSIYVGLYLQNTSGSFEVSASAGYNRIEGGDSGSWTSPTTGSTSNIYDLIFTYNVPSEWGDVQGALIFDHPDSGSLLFRCPFQEAITVDEADGFKISSGYLKIYID